MAAPVVFYASKSIFQADKRETKGRRTTLVELWTERLCGYNYAALAATILFFFNVSVQLAPTLPHRDFPHTRPTPAVQSCRVLFYVSSLFFKPTNRKQGGHVYFSTSGANGTFPSIFRQQARGGRRRCTCSPPPPPSRRNRMYLVQSGISYGGGKRRGLGTIVRAERQFGDQMLVIFFFFGFVCFFLGGGALKQFTWPRLIG